MKLNFRLKRTLSYFIILFTTIIALVGCGQKDSTTDLTKNPNIEKIRDAISSIEHIAAIEIVTEDNDPNGQLGKQGGYTGCLFFKYSLVKNIIEENPIDAGTDGGGCIEVYANEKDANKRNTYLSQFDGTIFSSGSHTVLGTLVIRTSSKLTASQQSSLETNIINMLTTK